MDQQFLFIFMILLLSCASNECSLISQSSIKTCQVGDSNEPTTNSSAGRTCKEKIVVSMTLMSDQKNSDSLYANVREVYQAGESKASLLKKPFRIEISKSETISSYRVYYRGSANAKPSEHSSLYEWRDDCRDRWNDPHLSRPRQPNTDGGVEWDSQGFCCRCGSKRENTYLKRPGAFCRNRDLATLLWHGYIELENDQLQKYGSSIHYMKLNDKWYDVFDIDQPILQYTVMVSLLEYNGILGLTESGVSVGNWTLLSSFELSPSNTVSRSPNGRVVARIEGELLGSSDPYDFITKKLLVPSSRVFSSDNTQPQKTTGTNEWMLVEESMVDLSGKECNKIGTSYTAFRSQPVACQRDSGTCFSNQPLDLLKHDGERFKSGKMGKYLLHNYGQVHPSTHPDDNSFILRFVHTSLHNSFVTFYIDASDIQFVVNSVRGRIVEVTASDFTVNEENGRIVVYVENVGEIAGDFLISLAHCHDNRVPSSKKTSIAPGQIKSVSFAFQAFVDKAQEVQCVVELYDVNYNLLGTSSVDLKVNVSCFCYGECGCVCNENGTVTIFECPEEPPVVIETGSIFLRLFLIVLRIVGIHGIVGFFAGILLILGFIKLLFGGVCCCRKSKAQAHYDKQKKKGVRVQQATLFKCTGECRGALMAKARQKRKVERIRKLGKDPYRLDDWRNTSFVCNCNDELTDIRCSNIIKSIFFFYYCFFLPFIWLGRKMWWSVFRDTMKNKEAAKKTVLRSAKKDGKLEILGMVDIGAELNNVMISDKKKEELTLSAQKAAVLENNTDKERVKTELSKDPKLAATSDPVPENLEDAAEPLSDKANTKKKGSKEDGQKSEMDTSQKSTEQVESFHSALLCVNATGQKPTSIEQIDSFHSALLCVNAPSEDHPKLAASEPVPANLGDATKLPGDKANKKKKGSKKDGQKSKKKKKGKTEELDTHIKKDRNIDRTAQKERKLTSRMHSPKPGKRVTGRSKHSDWMNEEVHDWDRADRKLEKISRRDENDDRRAPREPRSTSRSRRSDKQSSEHRERRGRSSRSRGARERRERSSRSRGAREKREQSSRSRGAREKRPREKTRFSREEAARDDKNDHNSDSDESKKEQKLTGKKSLSSIESKHEALAEKVSSHHSKELNNIYDEIASQHSSQHSLASNSKKDASVHSNHSSHPGAPSIHSDHSSHHGAPSIHSDHSSHHGAPSIHSDHSSNHSSRHGAPSIHSDHSSHHGAPSIHSDHTAHHGSQQPSVQESTRSSSLYSITSHSKSSVEDSKDDLHSSQASKQSSESNSTSNTSSSNRNTSHSTDHTGVATSSSTSQTDSSNLLSHTSASDVKENSSHSTGPISTMKSSSTSSCSNSSSTNSLPHSQDRTTSQESSVSSSEDNHDNTTEHTHSESSEESSDNSDSKDTTEHESSEESSDRSDSEPSEESDSEDSSEDDETDTSDEESEPESSGEHSQTDSSEPSSSEHSSHSTSHTSTSHSSHTPTSHSSHTPTSHSSHTQTMSSYTSSTVSSVESRRP